MSIRKTTWNRVPLIIRAVITGSLVFLVGTVVWSLVLGINLKVAPSIPWGAVVMMLFIWGYWRYLGGKGWPRSTAESRRVRLRVHEVPRSIWVWALTTGFLSVGSIVSLQLVYARVVRLAIEPVPDFSRYPFISVLAVLLTSAIVAGLMEEAGFRGYMQVPIEQRYGPFAASIIVGVLFCFWHFSHGIAHTVPRLPYYLAISVTYSAIAYLSNSLWPVVIIHVLGDALEFLYVWWRGAPRARPLLLESGPDAAFWVCFGLGAFLGLLAIGAFKKLAFVARFLRASPESPSA